MNVTNRRSGETNNWPKGTYEITMVSAVATSRNPIDSLWCLCNVFGINLNTMEPASSAPEFNRQIPAVIKIRRQMTRPKNRMDGLNAMAPELFAKRRRGHAD